MPLSEEVTKQMEDLENLFPSYNGERAIYVEAGKNDQSVVLKLKNAEELEDLAEGKSDKDRNGINTMSDDSRWFLTDVVIKLKKEKLMENPKGNGYELKIDALPKATQIVQEIKNERAQQQVKDAKSSAALHAMVQRRGGSLFGKEDHQDNDIKPPRRTM